VYVRVAMIRLDLCQKDLINIRFAYSPLLETLSSIRALQNPARHALYLNWIRQTQFDVENGIHPILCSLITQEGYVPDFLSPPPLSPNPDFDFELSLVKKTPISEIVKDITRLQNATYVSDACCNKLDTFLESPEQSLDLLCTELKTYWEKVLKVHWSRMQTVLEGDVLYRSKKLAFGGFEDLFEDLHPMISLEDNSLIIDKPYDIQVSLEGKGLLLVPIIFGYPEPMTLINTPRQPMISYHPKGIGLWTGQKMELHKALSLAFGKARASILTNLTSPITTQELAKVLDLSAGAVSQQLGRLKEAGMVESHRSNREVFYRLSVVGQEVLAAFTS